MNLLSTLAIKNVNFVQVHLSLMNMFDEYVWWIWNDDSAIGYPSCPKMVHGRLQDASEITCN